MKIVVKRRSKLQAGAGVKLNKADGNTLVRTRASTESPASGSEGPAVEVVGADGKLVKVVRHSTYTTPTAYPTILRTENGGVTAKLDGDGIQVYNGSYLIEMNPSGAAVIFQKASGPYSVYFNLAALVRNLELRVEDYCDAGVDKSQTHLASAPHV
jgi:hypothetical protein